MRAVLCERAPDRAPFPFAGTGESEGKLHCLVDLAGPCNMDCADCPRPGPQVATMEALADPLCDQVLWRARAARATCISAGFYGGEPLLAPEVIRALSRRTRQAAHSAGMAYEGACITNGSLLDDRLARGLWASGISVVQVTLAGPRARHDEIRRLRTGGPTFTRILDGLRYAREQLQILVRVETLGLENDELDELLGSLDAAGLVGTPGVSIYWAPPASYEEQLRDLWHALDALLLPAA